jgi:hypothetical protein
MPNRVIREGFLDSEAISALSDAAECFFHRLMLAADDAGRMDGRVEILRARLFPLDISRRASDVEKALAECIKRRLVIPYLWGGKRFLQISRWQRCSPALAAKYPDSPGGYRITFAKVDTRDGEKDFVASSMFGSGGLTGGEPIRNPGEYGSGMGLGRDKEGLRKGYDPSVSGDGDGDGDGDGCSNEPSPASPPPAIGLPLNTGDDFPITSDQVVEFRGLYPAVDVMQQLRAMRAWCIANPTKRKTRSGVMRFVNSWLAKEQDKGGRGVLPGSPAGRGVLPGSAPRPPAKREFPG